MGSWNGTCGLTQMPIVDGDKVVLFPVMKNKHADNGGGGFTYAHNQYSAISLPLYGEFDDYGGIENISKNENFVLDHFVKLAKRKLFTIDEKKLEREKSCFDKTITETPRNVKELVDSFMREPIYKGLGYMLVHASVYQKVVDEMSKRTGYGEKTTKRETYKKEANEFLNEYEKILSEVPSLEKELAKSREIRKTDPENKEALKVMMKVMAKLEVTYGNFENHFERNGFVQYYSEHTPNSMMKREMLLRLTEEPREGREELIQQYVDLLLFDIAMGYMRKMWTPQCGAGSQGSEYYLHKIIAESVIEKERQVVEEWFEENVAEEEEDREFGLNVTKQDIW